LRKAHPSTQIKVTQLTEEAFLKKGIGPRYSGLRVQGAAASPVGMISFRCPIAYIITRK